VNIVIGNLLCTATDQDLRQPFELYGTVDSITVMTDRETGHSCGSGFVDMPERSVAGAAIT
jgi:RNA recognition motif-containing protein